MPEPGNNGEPSNTPSKQQEVEVVVYRQKGLPDMRLEGAQIDVAAKIYEGLGYTRVTDEEIGYTRVEPDIQSK